MSLPVDFEAKVKAAPGVSRGYPTQLSAADLMRNFVHAALEADPSLIEQTTGQGGHQQRKLKIPAVQASGTYVLGSVNGTLTWLATEVC